MKKIKMLIPILAMALACALPMSAWGYTTDKLLGTDMDDREELFSIAGWNSEQDGKTSLENSLTVTLDEGAQSLADSGQLSYTIDVWGTCDECRTMTLSGSVKFYDKDGKELTV